MKIKFIIAKIYDIKSGENLKGSWKCLDFVARNNEKVTFENGETTDVMELMALRVRGGKVDEFVREVRPGSVIEATVRFNCEEKVSKAGHSYLQNDMVFSCPAWKVITY